MTTMTMTTNRDALDRMAVALLDALGESWDQFTRDACEGVADARRGLAQRPDRVRPLTEEDRADVEAFCTGEFRLALDFTGEPFGIDGLPELLDMLELFDQRDPRLPVPAGLTNWRDIRHGTNCDCCQRDTAAA